MLYQIKLPRKNIVFAIDMDKVDVINVDSIEPEVFCINLYTSNQTDPIHQINCHKLKYNEIMDLVDWLVEVKNGDCYITCFTEELLKH